MDEAAAANNFPSPFAWRTIGRKSVVGLRCRAAGHLAGRSVKVIDIFGNDTMTLVPVTAG